MGGGLHIASSLGVTESSQASWIAASYPLTGGAFMLMSGRLGSIYEHARIILLGASWWVLWSFINGFCTNFMAFNIARGQKRGWGNGGPERCGDYWDESSRRGGCGIGVWDCLEQGHLLGVGLGL